MLRGGRGAGRGGGGGGGGEREREGGREGGRAGKRERYIYIQLVALGFGRQGRVGGD
jgi:hypothetical protein